MVKYIIEGDIDFYDELYKSISKDESKESNEKSNEEFCLITNTPLTENFIKLDCGHKFNYIPLYNDILNHKKKFNNMENHILKNIEIRCPYCRKIQQNLLPYHSYPGVKQVHGVNYFDSTVILKNQCACCNNNMTFIIGKCEYEMVEEGEECPNTSVLLLDQNKKYYCLYHKYKMNNELNKKMKLDKIAFKKKQLEEEKQKKIEEKMKEKEEKMKVKEEKMKVKEELKEINKKAKVNKTENIVLSIMCCSQLLKKGGTCKQKQHTGTLCLRHFNLQKGTI